MTFKYSMYVMLVVLMVSACNTTSESDRMDECIFCEIVHNPKRHYVIWEDVDYMAFLSIYPNTDGVTVVIPKRHYPSHVEHVPNEVLAGTMLAAKKVQRLLQAALPDVGRVGFVIEGLGVNHLHVKLFPLHGTANHRKVFKSKVNTYIPEYDGYISTHNYYNYSDERLKKVYERIKRYQE